MQLASRKKVIVRLQVAITRFTSSAMAALSSRRCPHNRLVVVDFAMLHVAAMAVTLSLFFPWTAQASEERFADAANFTIAMVSKRKSSPYFDIARKGCQDAASRLGSTCLYEGPEVVDAEVVDVEVEKAFEVRQVGCLDGDKLRDAGIDALANNFAAPREEISGDVMDLLQSLTDKQMLMVK